ncbi:MAG TPA: hypothetical protein VI727_07995 [Candidatus Brocadiaceae bacterium]|nr:hypothetical protein [Candidatus Brocadiaceae bacterium]
MGNFVEALGRSQAITQAITGIQGIQQNELAIQNSKMQQAINEHTYKKAMEAETEANRLVPMDQILNQLEPEVKDFWIKSLQPYLKNGESGGLYIPMKHSDQVKNIVHDENFNMQTDKITLDALIKKEKLLQTQKAQMLQPDTEGKAQKQDKDAMVAIEQQITDIQKRKTELDQALDVFGRRKKEREDFTLQQGEKRFSGTGTEIATGGVKPTELPYKIGGRHTFTGKDGKSYEGTFKGLTNTNEPIFENATEIKGKPVQTELNPYQKFSAGHQLRNEIKANPYIKDYQDVSQKYTVMQRALKESQTSKTLVAVDQALITLFNKMTDPTSVVRESEYARTPEDMAIYNRIQGKIDKLRTGGAGMTADERNALVRMAQNFMEVYQGNYDQTITDYEELANQSGLDPKVIGIPYERKNKQIQVKDKLKQKYGLE